MNGTGSGELDTYGVSNILDVGVRNYVRIDSGAYTNLGTTSIPQDDTIPQNTEGNAITALDLGIVPTSSNSILIIRFSTNLSTSGSSNNAVLALFQDSTASALTSVQESSVDAQMNSVTIDYKMKAGTTSFTQFKVRAGNSGGATFHINGTASGAARLYGGVSNSYAEVEEIHAELT
jgi:hypothetical protein